MVSEYRDDPVRIHIDDAVGRIGASILAQDLRQRLEVAKKTACDSIVVLEANEASLINNLLIGFAASSVHPRRMIAVAVHFVHEALMEDVWRIVLIHRLPIG